MSMTAQEKAALQTILVVAEAIRDLGSVASGKLYTHLMGHMSLEVYNKIIDILVKQGVCKVENHLITYTGPKKES